MSNIPTPKLSSLPLFDGIGENGQWPWANTNKSVREVMLNILLTRPGERLMRPEFGAGIDNYVHLPNTETTRALIADVVKRALTRWEPRVDLDTVTVQPDPQRPSHVNLSIRYRLRYGGEVDSLDLALELSTLA